MTRVRALCLLLVATLASASAFAGTTKGRSFEWTTKSAEAKKLLGELQGRIESFQFGAANVELAKKIVAADPSFAMGVYYLSAVTPDPVEAEKHYQKSRELAKTASEGERRFIEAMIYNRTNQGIEFQKSIPHLEALAADYPGERLIQVILGQLQNGDGQGGQGGARLPESQGAGHEPPRRGVPGRGGPPERPVRQGTHHLRSRREEPPQGLRPLRHPFRRDLQPPVRGKHRGRARSLETYLAEYKANGLDQQFPEVFVWNAIGRIHLETGNTEAALKAYEKGYESVPASKLPEDQKNTWLGRLHHGKSRVLARMGKHAEAWAEAETVRKMILAGGEAGRQFWPAYHYVAGYAKLEAGETAEALEHLLQADAKDPFHTVLLARAYEKVGRKEEAKKAYQKVLDSKWAGIERPLAYTEAKKRLSTL